MTVGAFFYPNASGYSDRIENPDPYQTYNITIRSGLVDNQTNSTVTLYSLPDCRGDSQYLNSNTSAYISTSFESFRFTT
ncbi:hypothetical protein [Nocardia cyriacigeorgica]|uniref:hypothetical protein n=1 Tax=Nocardia cyriacigeorgica TaxID=135487 RepID=UPI002457EBE8|nr:hypothetical protein [Nocardia cyriacigeorgica]